MSMAECEPNDGSVWHCDEPAFANDYRLLSYRNDTIFPLTMGSSNALGSDDHPAVPWQCAHSALATLLRCRFTIFRFYTTGILFVLTLFALFVQGASPFTSRWPPSGRASTSGQTRHQNDPAHAHCRPAIHSSSPRPRDLRPPIFNLLCFTSLSTCLFQKHRTSCDSRCALPLQGFMPQQEQRVKWKFGEERHKSLLCKPHTCSSKLLSAAKVIEISCASRCSRGMEHGKRQIRK